MLHSPPPTPPREKKRVHALESAAADVVFATALQQVTMQAQIDKLTSDLAVMSAKSTRDEEELIQLRALSRSSASAQGMKTDREAQEAGQFDDADVSMFDDSAAGRQQLRGGVKAVSAALLGACTPRRGTLGFLQRRDKASVGKRDRS